MGWKRGRAMANFFGPLLILIVSGYLLLCGLLFVLQARLLYYPDMGGRELRATPADIGLEYESVNLKTEDGITIHGWYVPAGTPRGTLLFFHGNAGNISHRLDSLQIFNHLGLSTFIIDYRGYGQSGGKATEEGTYRDAAAAWRYLTKQKNIDSRRIIVFGRSLGGAIAAHLAAEHQPAGLIMESTFTSVPDLAAGIYPVFPVRLLSRFQYDARQAVKQVDCPVLIVHSPEDDIIPYRHGEALFAAAGEPKQFLEIRGSHNEGFLESGPLYYEGLEAFVDSCLADKRQLSGNLLPM